MLAIAPASLSRNLPTGNCHQRITIIIWDAIAAAAKGLGVEKLNLTCAMKNVAWSYNMPTTGKNILSAILYFGRGILAGGLLRMTEHPIYGELGVRGGEL